MSEKIRTLLFSSNGFGREAIRSDTSFHLLLKRLHTGDPKRIFGGYTPSFSGSGLPCLDGRYEPLSYARDWEDAFLAHPALAVDICNVTDLLGLRCHLKRIQSYDLIVVLHSAAGDDMRVISRAARALQERRGRLVLFFGNEYDLMAEKIAFANKTGADFVCSQLPLDCARWLYEGVSTAQIVEMPHALNAEIYKPDSSVQRVVDIGFRGALYHSTIGDLERTRFIATFAEICPKVGLIADIQLANLPRYAWAHYLRHLKALVGAESGTYYLQRSGEAIRKALQYQREYPEAQFDEVFRFAFEGITDYRDGKCISSRHFEPIGTRTCQILLEGKYNGILRPDEHYIPVRKDYSDLEEALRKFRDESYRTAVAQRAFEHVMEHHTYERRVHRLVSLTAGV